MLEHDLKEIWKNSSKIEQIKFDLSRLLIELDRKMTKIERVIKARDFREIAASVFGIFLFAYFTYEIPFPITKVACVLSIGWFVYVIYRLKDNKKKKIPVDLTISLKEQLENQKTNMLREASLLDTVLYWYVIPPYLINILFFIGFGDPVAYDWTPFLIEKILESIPEIIPSTIYMKSIYIIGNGVFFGLIVLLNKLAVKNDIMPIVKEIDQVLSQLEKEY